jgi:glyoxylase-like metal-dependent hydrolase (beta-lactamase superfamily II)
VLDLGGRSVMISHPGFGHTCHDLIVVVADAGPPVVFCGDLVEESGDPTIGPDPDPKAWPATLARVLDAGGPDAAYVPGHGRWWTPSTSRARRESWPLVRCDQFRTPGVT